MFLFYQNLWFTSAEKNLIQLILNIFNSRIQRRVANRRKQRRTICHTQQQQHIYHDFSSFFLHEIFFFLLSIKFQKWLISISTILCCQFTFSVLRLFVVSTCRFVLSVPQLEKKKRKRRIKLSVHIFRTFRSNPLNSFPPKKTSLMLLLILTLHVNNLVFLNSCIMSISGSSGRKLTLVK